MNKSLFAATLGGLAILLLVNSPTSRAETPAPPYMQPYALTGTLSSIGSDTMVYLVSFWAVEFKKIYPRVQVRISQAGSSTAPPALTNDESNLGPMSRPMKAKEIAEFEKRHGYPPTEIRVALDTLAVYANQKNPIAGLTMQQVDAVFSAERRCGEKIDAQRWGQVGATGEWADRDIELYGRNLISGTYVFFREHVLCRGDFRKTLQMKPTSAEVVNNVMAKPNAIGYSGIGYLRPGVRAVPLAARAGQPYVEATPENARTGRYPITRFLYLYVNKAPGKPLPPLEREFLRFVLSGAGQAVVENDGFVPLTGEQLRAEQAKLD